MTAFLLDEYSWHSIIGYSLSPIDVVNIAQIFPNAKAAAPRLWRKIATSLILDDKDDRLGDRYSKTIWTDISNQTAKQILISVAPFVQTLAFLFDDKDSTVYHLILGVFKYKVTVTSSNDIDEALELLINNTSAVTSVQLVENFRLQVEMFIMLFNRNSIEELTVNLLCFNEICERRLSPILKDVKELFCTFTWSESDDVRFNSFQMDFPNLQVLRITVIGGIRSKEEFQNICSMILPFTRNIKKFDFIAGLDASVPVRASDGLESLVNLSQLQSLHLELVFFSPEGEDGLFKKVISCSPLLNCVTLAGITLSEETVSTFMTPEMDIFSLRPRWSFRKISETSENLVLINPGYFIIESIRTIPTSYHLRYGTKVQEVVKFFERIFGIIFIVLSQRKTVVITVNGSREIIIVKQKGDHVVGGFSLENTQILNIERDKKVDCRMPYRLLKKVQEYVRKNKDDHHAFICDFE